MKSIKCALATLWRDDEGLTTVEYAIAGGVIAVGVILSFTNLGARVKVLIDNLVTALGG